MKSGKAPEFGGDMMLSGGSAISGNGGNVALAGGVSASKGGDVQAEGGDGSIGGNILMVTGASGGENSIAREFLINSGTSKSVVGGANLLCYVHALFLEVHYQITINLQLSFVKRSQSIE